MNTIATLRERRARIVAEMRAMADLAGTEERDLTDDESKQFDGLKADNVKLERQIERAESVAEAERSMAAKPVKGSFTEATTGYSMFRAIKGLMDARSVDDGLEREVSRELELRTGRSARGILVPYKVEQRDVLTTGTGGNLVPNPLAADQYVEPLRIQPQVVRAGARVLDGLVGDVDIPAGLAVTTTSTVAEHGQVSETSPSYRQIALRPKTVGAYVEMSRRMIINSTPSIEQLLRSDLSASINLELDRQALVGTGTSNEAEGITTISGVGSVSFGGAPTWAKVQEMVATCAAANAEMGALAFMGNSRTRKELLDTLMATSTDSRHITEDPNGLAGFPFLMANNLPGDPTSSPVVDGTLLYANWSDLLLGMWSGIDLLMNPYHSDVFDRGGALLSAFLDFDVQVRHAESFVKADDITLT